MGRPLRSLVHRRVGFLCGSKSNNSGVIQLLLIRGNQYTRFFKWTQTQKSSRFRLGKRGGHVNWTTSDSLPITNLSFSNYLTKNLICGSGQSFTNVLLILIIYWPNIFRKDRPSICWFEYSYIKLKRITVNSNTSWYSYK